MLVRVLIALAVLLAVGGAFALWKRPPRRLGRMSLCDIGIGGPAVVQFSTPSCAPCRAAKPRLLEAARQAEVPYAQIDVGERPDVARRYGIRTVPTIVVTGRDGRIVGVWTSVPANGDIAQAARAATVA